MFTHIIQGKVFIIQKHKNLCLPYEYVMSAFYLQIDFQFKARLWIRHVFD